MRTAFFFLFISSLFFSVSCDKSTQTDEPNSGVISFLLTKNAIPSEARLVAVRLERTGHQTIRDSVVVGTTTDTVKFQLKDIPTGSWLFTVEARDSLSFVRYRGKATINVNRGQTTEVIALVWTTPTFKWTMSPSNPVVQQTPGGWDEKHFFFIEPTVIKVGGVYRMWYTTGLSLSVNGEEKNWIAYATSSDGISWTKQGAVVYPGPVGSWNERGSVNPTVIYDNGVYKMWFEGISSTKYHYAIGYAESNDGLVWGVNEQPVFQSNTSHPEYWTPCVLKKDNLYYMYIGIGRVSGSTIDIYLYTSTNAITWTERGKVLAARPEVFWEQNGITAPYVIYDQNKFRMFYTGFGYNLAYIGYAESTDGIIWQRYGTSPALSTVDTAPWTTSWVAYPCVMKEEGKLKIWFSALTSQPYRWQTGYAYQTE